MTRRPYLICNGVQNVSMKIQFDLINIKQHPLQSQFNETRLFGTFNLKLQLTEYDRNWSLKILIRDRI